LYTLDSWVCKDLNSFLREQQLTQEAGIIYACGLIHTYKNLGSKIQFFSGLVYRRIHLTPKQIKSYVEVIEVKDAY